MMSADRADRYLDIGTMTVHKMCENGGTISLISKIVLHLFESEIKNRIKKYRSLLNIIKLSAFINVHTCE